MDFSSWHQQSHDLGHLYFLKYNLLLDTFLLRYTAPNFLKHSQLHLKDISVTMKCTIA